MALEAFRASRFACWFLMLAFAAVPLVSRRYRLAFDLRIAWMLLWLSFLVAGEVQSVNVSDISQENAEK